MTHTTPLKTNPNPTAAGSATLSHLQAEQTILLTNSEGWYNVKLNQILYCSSDNYYTIFHLKGNKTVMLSGSLKQFEEALAAYGFLRVHQKNLVNTLEVETVLKKDGACQAQLSDGSRIAISCRERQTLIDQLKQQSIPLGNHSLLKRLP